MFNTMCTYESANDDLAKKINELPKYLKKHDKGKEKYDLLIFLLKNMETIYTSICINDDLDYFIGKMNIRPIFEMYIYILYLIENKEDYNYKQKAYYLLNKKTTQKKLYNAVFDKQDITNGTKSDIQQNKAESIYKQLNGTKADLETSKNNTKQELDELLENYGSSVTNNRKLTDFYNIDNINSFADLATHLGESEDYKLLIHNTSMFIHGTGVYALYSIDYDESIPEIKSKKYDIGPSPKQTGFHFLSLAFKKVIKFLSISSYYDKNLKNKVNYLETKVLQETHDKFNI